MLERVTVEERREQRRLARPVRPDEPDLLAALDDELRALEELLVSRGERDVVGFEHDAAAARRVEEVEAEAAALRRQRCDLLARRAALLLEAGDLRELGLRLLRLRLLVPEPLDEALQPRDVLGHALRRPAGCGRTRRLLLSPLVPRPGEVVRAARASSSTDVVTASRNQRSCATRMTAASSVSSSRSSHSRLLHVEVVRRLVEEQQIGAPGERARKRGARQLAAGERAERPVEIVLREAEAAHAPRPRGRARPSRPRARAAPEPRA